MTTTAAPTTAPRSTELASTDQERTRQRGVRRLAKAVAGSLVALMLVLTFAGRPADAINPNQTSAQGVLNVQASWYGGVNDFWARTLSGWGYSYTRPALYWYNSATGNMYNTLCGPTLRNNGFFCSRNNAIYLDANYMQYLINTRGDYAAAGFIAHEWAHAIAFRVGYRYWNSAPGSELMADCLAGMATRWGYTTGRLVGSDYGEFYGWLASQATSASHSSGANRSAWYQFGYQQNNINQCSRALPAATIGGAVAGTSAPQVVIAPVALPRQGFTATAVKPAGNRIPSVPSLVKGGKFPSQPTLLPAAELPSQPSTVQGRKVP